MQKNPTQYNSFSFLLQSVYSIVVRRVIAPPPHSTLILHAYLYVIVTQKKKENLSERATSYMQKTAEVVKTLKIMIFAEAPLPQL